MLIERLQITRKVSKFFYCSDLVWWFVYLFLVGMRKASHNGLEFWKLRAGFALTFQNLFLRWGCIYVLYDMSRVIISCHLLFHFSRFDWDARCMVSSGPYTCLLKVAEKFSTKGKSKLYCSHVPFSVVKPYFVGYFSLFHVCTWRYTRTL